MAIQRADHELGQIWEHETSVSMDFYNISGLNALLSLIRYESRNKD